jgi:hypothetical protein
MILCEGFWQWLAHYGSTSDEASSNSTGKRFFGIFTLNHISS